MTDKPVSPPPLPRPQPELAGTLSKLASQVNLAAGVGILAVLAALGYAGLYFMPAGGLFGSAARKYSVGHGTAGGMPATYLALAFLFFYLTGKLFALQSSIGRWMRSQSPENLEEIMIRKKNLASECKIPALLVVLILCQIFFG